VLLYDEPGSIRVAPEYVGPEEGLAALVPTLGGHDRAITTQRRAPDDLELELHLRPIDVPGPDEPRDRVITAPYVSARYLYELLSGMEVGQNAVRVPRVHGLEEAGDGGLRRGSGLGRRRARRASVACDAGDDEEGQDGNCVSHGGSSHCIHSFHEIALEDVQRRAIRQ
jgi:hypothetical protein